MASPTRAGAPARSEAVTFRTTVLQTGSNTGILVPDEVEVTLRLDREPRAVAIPSDLRAALAESGALDAFEASAPSRKKEDVRQVEDAKTPETRARRITQIVARFTGA